MKLQKSEQIKLVHLGFFACLLSLFCSCENDIEAINALSQNPEEPDEIALNISYQYSDSAKLFFLFSAPRMEGYSKLEEPMHKFPKGIDVTFYDDSGRVESTVIAGYAEYYREKRLWKARDNVIAKNVQTGEKLNTEELFWNEKDRLFYSEVYTKITSEDGIFIGEKGFEAQQDMSSYKLIGSEGTVNVRDEE